MSMKAQQDKESTNYPWTARHRRQKIEFSRQERKKSRKKTRNI